MRVVVTRARRQAGELAARLVAAGFVPVEVPVIDIADPADGGAGLRAAAEHLAEYDWIIVTSVNGAERLASVAPPPWPAPVAAIGPGTAARLREHGIEVALVPDRFVAESLLEAFPSPSSADEAGGSARRVLLARAAVARDVLPVGLAALGYDVDVVDAYRTLAPTLDAATVAAAASAEAITFTSASTVRNYVDLVGLAAVPSLVASIGPVTSAACRDQGIVVTVEAARPSLAALVQALVEQRDRAAS
jgi:uroporphyrinogen-III synthase